MFHVLVRTVKEKEVNIWALEEKKNSEGKGGKYLVREGEGERRRKRRIIFREGKYLISGGEEER